MNKTIYHYRITKTQLIIVFVLYLMLVNAVLTHNFEHFIQNVFIPSLITVVLLLMTSIHRYLLKFLIILLSTIGAISLYYKYKYKSYITEDVLLSGMINDHTLTSEMLDFNVLIWLFVIVSPCLLLCFVRIKKQTWPAYFMSTSITAFICIAFLITSLIIVGFAIKDKGHIRDHKLVSSFHAFSPMDTIFSFSRASKTYQNILKNNFDKDMSQISNYEISDRINNDIDDLKIVIIMGEAARADRFSLNGYARNTNPNLLKVSNLYNFSNVMSCGTTTIASLRCLMSKNTKNDALSKDPTFFDILNSFGFQREIYSLQTIHHFYNYLGYDKLRSKYSILANSREATDRNLLPHFQSTIHEIGKKLIFLHTLGSHQSYHNRFLKKEAVFAPYCEHSDVSRCSKVALDNAYDNTIIATDTFISNVIGLLENKKAIVFYISDHGQSLGENGMFFHGAPMDIAPIEQRHVPFMVWLSNRFITTEQGRKVSEKLAVIEPNTKLSHDNFFHSIIGCIGIKARNDDANNHLNLCH